MLEEEVGEEEPEDGRTTSGAELRTLLRTPLRTPRVGTRHRLSVDEARSGLCAPL